MVVEPNANKRFALWTPPRSEVAGSTIEHEIKLASKPASWVISGHLAERIDKQHSLTV
jgi:hypothetical protein